MIEISCDNCLYSCVETKQMKLEGGGMIPVEISFCKNDSSPNAKSKVGVADWGWCSCFSPAPKKRR